MADVGPGQRQPDPSRPIVVANCSGFLGDRRTAAREQVEGGAIDVLTGDWLAELTMLILARQRLAGGPGAGYARPFVRALEDVLGPCLDRGIRIVSNAGGLDPDGCAAAVRALAERLGLHPRVAVVTGDDLTARPDALGDAVNLDTGERLADLRLQPLTANAYLGGFGVSAALAAGADVVITGRTTDAALVSGPAAWWFGWTPDDLDALAGAVVAGHVIECGTQATGGNYAFFEDVPDLTRPGFPIAEIAADGSAVITKHPGTGGLVDVGTVTAQLLYEIAGPAYAGPDVTARFDTVTLTQVGADRVAISGTRGERPPATLKVAVTALGGFRNAMTLVLTGPDRDAKAALVARQLAPVLAGIRDVTLHRLPAGDEREELRYIVADADRDAVGKRFTAGLVELALASYPGFFPTAPPADPSPFGLYWPTSVPVGAVDQHVTLDGEPLVTLPGGTAPLLSPAVPVETRTGQQDRPSTGPGPTEQPATRPDDGVTVPLGRLVGTRSGDKGGTANVGCWVRDPAQYPWLVATVTPAAVQRWVPGAEDLPVTVHPLPNLHAVNIVIPGLLGRGVSSNTLLDPQAKALGELLRTRPVTVPATLLDGVS
jgi:hypothetical protein